MALAELGRSLWALKRPDAAIANLRRAIEQEPWQVTFLLNLARMLAATGRMQDATSEGLQAARLDPDALEVWDVLVNLSRAAGREDPQARRQLERLQRNRR